MLPQMTLVLGGAASGKSAFAERLCAPSGAPRIYIATAQAGDEEMTAKIAAHQTRRGVEWDTLEAPQDLSAALSRVAEGRVVLVDCATMWLANQMAADADIARASSDLMQAVEKCASPVVIVSNELGQGVVPDNALARAFRQAQGELNQKLAAQAGLVVAVMAGLPLTLKGDLPEGMS